MQSRYIVLFAAAVLLLALFCLIPVSTGPAVQQIRFSSISSVPVHMTPETMTFNETAALLNNRTTPAGNLFLQLRVYDKDDGRVIAENTTRIRPIGPGGSGAVSLEITVPRDKMLRFIYSVYEHGRIVAQSVNSAGDYGEVPPFERIDGPVISRYGYRYEPPLTGGSTVLVNITLRNNDRLPSPPAVLEARERDEETLVIADRKTIPVPELGPHETRNFQVTLTVPGRQNYLLQFMVTRNGSVIARDDMDFWLKPGFFGDNTTHGPLGPA